MLSFRRWIKVKLNFQRNLMVIKLHQGMWRKWPSHRRNFIMNFLPSLAPRALNSVFQKLDFSVPSIWDPRYHQSFSWHISDESLRSIWEKPRENGGRLGGDNRGKHLLNPSPTGWVGRQKGSRRAGLPAGPVAWEKAVRPQPAQGPEEATPQSAYGKRGLSPVRSSLCLPVKAHSLKGWDSLPDDWAEWDIGRTDLVSREVLKKVNSNHKIDRSA